MNTDIPVEDVYEQLCSLKNLEAAFEKARRGKTLKPYVIEFEKHLKENLLQLRSELLMQTYHPQPLKVFILHDPKTRKISKSEFRDFVHDQTKICVLPEEEKRRFMSWEEFNKF
ncbi:MAG: hypothetical protein AABW49_03150 [Nanoarchaeota archaeon]